MKRILLSLALAALTITVYAQTPQYQIADHNCGPDGNGGLNCAKVQGVVNAALASGSDIGAKVNAAQGAGSVEVEVPAGTYTQTTPIVLVSGVKLRFDRGAKLVKGFNGANITIPGSNSATPKHIAIIDPDIDGNEANTATLSALSCDGTTCTATLTAALPASYTTGGTVVVSNSGISGVDNQVQTIASTPASNQFTFANTHSGTASSGTTTGGYSGSLITVGDNGATIYVPDDVVISDGTYRNTLSSAVLVQDASSVQVANFHTYNVMGDNISVTGNSDNINIGPGICDMASVVTWHKCLSAHSAYTGKQIQTLTINPLTIVGAYSFGIEVGAFGGLSPFGVTVTSPTERQMPASGHGYGGYSFDSVINLSITNPVYYNFTGVAATLPGVEIVNTDHFSVTGGVIVGANISLNKARHGSVTGATIHRIYPGSGIYMGTSATGADADYLTVQANNIDRTGLVKGRTTWAASTNYAIGFIITDGTNLEMVVSCAATPCVSGSTAPSTASTSPGQTVVDNVITWINIGPYISSPSSAYGIYLQCNAVADCSYNAITGNTLVDDGTATNNAIVISNGAGTVTHIVASANILTGWPTCYYVSASAYVDLWLNDETGCTALGSTVTSGITAGTILYRGSSATNKTNQPWITTSTVEADGGYYVGALQVIGSNGRLLATSLPAGTNYLDFPNAQVNVWAQDTGTTMSYFGVTGTTFGTITHAQATSTGALPPKANVATAATSASLAGYQDVPNYLVSKNPDWQAWAGIPSSGDYVNTRIWLGLGGGASTDYNSDTPADSYAAFRASTTAGDTNWKCVTSNGTSQTVADSGVAITEGGGNRFEVALVSATSATFLINGTQVCSITTNLPTGLLASKMYTVTQENVAKNLWIERWFVAMNP